MTLTTIVISNVDNTITTNRWQQPDSTQAEIKMSEWLQAEIADAIERLETTNQQAKV